MVLIDETQRRKRFNKIWKGVKNTGRARRIIKAELHKFKDLGNGTEIAHHLNDLPFTALMPAALPAQVVQV